VALALTISIVIVIFVIMIVRAIKTTERNGIDISSSINVPVLRRRRRNGSDSVRRIRPRSKT
jgi:hypothetical protein